MHQWISPPIFLATSLVLYVCAGALGSTIRIGTFNVENYLDVAAGTRPAKSAEAKARVRESLLALHPDIVALQEMGSTNTLQELRSGLATAGLNLPHSDWVQGYDTNIHIAILSRFPIVARRPHTNANFLLDGHRFQVSRGFAEVDIQAAPQFTVTILAAHLKSKRPIPNADESEIRLEEAKVLREIVDERLNANPRANLIVLGDLNDWKDSPSTKIIIGKGKSKLLDTRPTEKNGDERKEMSRGHESRQISWTHFYAKEDTYSRLDYILLSPALAPHFVREQSFVLRLPNWGAASDHCPLLVTLDDGK